MFDHRRCLWCLVLFSMVISQPVAADVVFPKASGVINVLDYGAKPNDGQDDTLAIQQALADHPTGNHVFYFPHGVYDISDTLMRLPTDDPHHNTKACLELRGTLKRNIFQGEREEDTVLRLMDSVPETFSGAMINFGPAPAQRFRNSVRNLTISIGRGHPQATALQFNASNQGTLKHVTIQSEDPQKLGRIGLDMGYTDEVGPLQVKDVTIDGFEIGIRTAYQTASQTFEDITLRNQQRVGWQNGFAQQVFVHGLTSRNSVPVVANTPGGGGDPGQGRFVLVNARLTGTDAAITQPAIRNHKSMYLRDVETSGYQTGVTRELAGYRGNSGRDSGTIDEYWANGAYENRRGGPFELFPSPDRMLCLPIRPTPKIPWGQLKEWAGPQQFQTGQPGTGSGFPDDGADDTAAIQAAIDSGAKTVYLPNGHWHVAGTVILRGDVHRLIGCEARLTGMRNQPPGVVQLAQGAAPVVIVERLESGRILYRHSSDRTWVLAHLLGGDYESNVESPGDLFLEDIVFDAMVFRHQNVWARQLDIETNTQADPKQDAKIVNDAGTVWILGLKTEDAGTIIQTVNGGKTEVLGSLHVGDAGNDPRFVTTDSAFSIAGVNGGGFPIQAVETRNGETRHTHFFQHADVYTAFSAETISDREVVLDTENDQGIQHFGEWADRSGFPGGFHGSGFKYTKVPPTDRNPSAVVFEPSLPKTGRYEISMRWVRPVSGFELSKAVPIELQTDKETHKVQVDQSQNGGLWVSIGTFDLKKDTTTVTLKTAGTRGHVVADAIRFVLVE